VTIANILRRALAEPDRFTKMDIQTSEHPKMRRLIDFGQNKKNQKVFAYN